MRSLPQSRLSLSSPRFFLRGCETWIVREGYEGLVRGNGDQPPPPPHEVQFTRLTPIRDQSFLSSLRFGDGALLKDGTADNSGGRTLKGRYIIRVGWDDVRGWFSEVSRRLASSNLVYLTHSREVL